MRGATVNATGGFVMRADRVGTDTLLSQIVQMVAEAQRSRAPIQKLADVVAGYFVPAVVLVAGTAFVVWALVGPEPRLAHALIAAVAVVATVRQRFAAGWIYGEGAYLIVGKPAGVELNNAVLWRVGGGRRLTDRLYLLASAYGNSALLSRFGAPAEVGAGLGLKLGEHANLTVLPTVGLSNASPKYAFTVGISSDLTPR